MLVVRVVCDSWCLADVKKKYDMLCGIRVMVSCFSQKIRYNNHVSVNKMKILEKVYK